MSNSNIFLGCLAEADNLRAEDAAVISDLVTVFNSNRVRNRTLGIYYDAKVSLQDINIGIAIPDNIVAGLGCACSWPAIAVQSLQRRSHFDSIQSPYGDVKGDYDLIIQENRLISNYRKACIEQLKTGCVFATLSMGEEGRANIRWHTAQSASALWDGVNDRIAAGMAIISTKKFNRDRSFKPSRVHVYTDTDTIVLISADGVNWSASYIPHKMGRPLFGALIYKPSFSQPFGESRITRAVMAHTDTALRAMCRLELAAEVYSSPQKVLLNASESLAEQVRQQQHSMAMYLSNMLALTADEETGEQVDIKVLAAASMEPHISVLKEAAALFASDTGVPLNSLGIVQDNPSSAEAIYAQKEDLVIQTQDLNAENGWSLVDLCRMAHCINTDTDYYGIDDAHKEVEAHFMNPSTPSIASSADAYIKISSVLPQFASSPVGLEMLGLDNEQIMRLRSHMDTQTADNILSELTAAVKAASSNDES